MKVAAFLVFVACGGVLAGVTGDPVEGSRLLEEAFRDYDKRIRPNYGGSPVMVNVSLYILNIPQVDPTSNTFQLSFYIRQSWTDPRFFFNSRRNIDTIMLDSSTSERIWSPDTFFVNELSSVAHNVLVKNQFCRISQNGSVLLSRRVTITAFSPMNARLFPYDRHTLTLQLESYGYQTRDLKYQWGEEGVSWSALSRPDFRVAGVLATQELLRLSTGSYSRLLVNLTAQRNPLPFELGVTLPVALLTLLCWATLFTPNAPLAAILSLYLASLIALVNLLLFVSGILGSGVQCLCPLQVHGLLSFCLALLCWHANLRRSSNSNTDASGGIKSRTESTSENSSKSEEPPITQVADAENEGTTATPNTSSRWRRWKGPRCMRGVLLLLILTMNAIYVALFRLLLLR